MTPPAPTPDPATEAQAMRYFLDQDNSMHWYLVEADHGAEWDAWTSLPDDDPAGWACPGYAERLDGGPSRVTFENPDTRGR